MYAFFRGSLPVFREDWRLGVVDLPQSGYWAFTIGDAHPENFGFTQNEDDTLFFGPNDFDAADEYPLEWDVLRMAVGMGLAANTHNLQRSDETPLHHAESMIIDAYVAAFNSYASFDEAQGVFNEESKSELIRDLESRAKRDLANRDELNEFCEGSAENLFFRRGILNEEEPRKKLASVPIWLVQEITEALAGIRPNEEVLDVVRYYGSGVASLPRIRLLVLVRRENSFRIYEVKEAGDSFAPTWLSRPRPFANLKERVVRAQKRLWPKDVNSFLDIISLQSAPFQVRLKAASQKTLRTRRIKGKKGTPEAFSKSCAELGTLLALLHRRSLESNVHLSESWKTRMINAATRYTARTLDDFRSWQTLTNQKRMHCEEARLEPSSEDLHFVGSSQRCELRWSFSEESTQKK